MPWQCPSLLETTDCNTLTCAWPAVPALPLSAWAWDCWPLHLLWLPGWAVGSTAQPLATRTKLHGWAQAEVMRLAPQPHQGRLPLSVCNTSIPWDGHQFKQSALVHLYEMAAQLCRGYQGKVSI
jgi:hypothetical protein